MARADAELITPGEVCRRLGIDLRSLARWADAGKITVASRTQGNHRRYRADDVEALRTWRGTPRVVSWDWREQPDIDELAAAVRELSDGLVHVTQVETCSDEYAIVLAGRPLDAEEAYRLWSREDG